MKTGLWNGITLLAERVRDPEVQVLLRFLGGEVKASTADPSNPGFTAEIRLCMELRGVGLYPGFAVFINSGAHFAPAHMRGAMFTQLPGVDEDDLQHNLVHVPESMRDLVAHLCTRHYILVSGLQVGNSPTTCRMTASLERNGERFETAEWIDGEHVS